MHQKITKRPKITYFSNTFKNIYQTKILNSLKMGYSSGQGLLSTVIRWNGYTRKISCSMLLNRGQWNIEAFICLKSNYSIEIHFVFVDETGIKSKDHMRRFGYALRGKSSIQHGIIHKGGRISAIAAVASTGVVAIDMMTGSVNGEVFFGFVRTLLIP